MNIFVLDYDKKKAAAMHVDKHVVKMPLETAQILCTVHHIVGSDKPPYRLTHKNHPCCLWVRESLSNYFWLLEFGMELCREYTCRYGKVHKSQLVIEWCFDNIPNIPDNGLTPFAIAVPIEYKRKCAVEAYRAYYVGDKQHIAQWKTKKPYWYEISS